MIFFYLWFSLPELIEQMEQTKPGLARGKIFCRGHFARASYNKTQEAIGAWNAWTI